jgi:predicted ATPase
LDKKNAPRAEMLELLEELEDNRLTTAHGGPLHVSLAKGAPESRLAVMVGDNAGGKSLMVKFLASLLNGQDTEPLQVSMRYRTMAGMHRVFMFGDDAEESTGAVSLFAVEGALRTANGREKSCWVLLDEPDTGLSDSYCRALGAYLAEQANKLPAEHFEAMVVVTHSKTLVASLLANATHRPHFIAVGEHHAGQQAEDWLADTSERSVEELLGLHTKGLDTWRAVNKVLKSKED